MAATASSASKQAPSTVVQHGGVQPLVSTGAARPRSGIATSSAWKGFWFSGLACCVAEAVTIPVDVVKTRYNKLRVIGWCMTGHILTLVVSDVTGFIRQVATSR
mgnify:CR=1 FL=1